MEHKDIEVLTKKIRREAIKARWFRTLDLAFLAPELIVVAIKTIVVVSTLLLLGVL